MNRTHRYRRPVSSSVLAATLAALSPAAAVRGAILAEDSFAAPQYELGANLQNLKPADTAGFTGATWGGSGSTGVFYVNDGLEFPAGFAATASGGAIGVGKFTGSQTGSREISRPVDADAIGASGTYFLRFLCTISESAEKSLGFKGFELLGLLPEAHAGSSAISYPSAGGLQFGFYKFAAGEGNTALAVLKDGGANANVGALKLVDPAVPGKTYLVVAKIVLDGEGAADVYAFAGATDDPALFLRSLPEEPFRVAVKSSAALRHLVLSGAFMTGYADGRYASFDEFAVGETLDDVFAFSDSGDPILAPVEATAVTASGFTAGAELLSPGSSAPAVYLDLSADGGETWTGIQVGEGPVAEAGPVSATVEGLDAGATYWWRFRAVGGAEPVVTPWSEVTLPGKPVFGAASAAVDGTTATFSATLEEPGLSGSADTTVELWLGESGGALELVRAFDAVREAASFETEIAGLALGGAYEWAFRATVPSGSGVLEVWTETAALAVSGELEWTGAGGTGDWNSAVNWNPSAVPNERLDVNFAAVGGTAASSSASAAASLAVNTAGDGTTLDFGGGSLSAGSVTVGYRTTGSLLRLSAGDFSVAGKVAVPGAATRANGKIVVGGDATLDAAALDVGYSAQAASSNSVVFAAGSKGEIAGAITLLPGRGSSVAVESGASLKAGSLSLQALGAVFSVDGGEFENEGPTYVFREKNRGTVVDPTVLELRGGAVGRFKDAVYVGAGRNNSGAFTHGEIRVLDGATFDATGAGVFVDQGGDKGNGPNDDSASYGACVVVSNATLLANSVSVNNEDRHHDDFLLVHEDEGAAARVATTGNIRVASADWNRNATCNYGNRLRVESGEVSVGGSLIVGDGGAHYEAHSDNRVEIAGGDPRVSARALTVYGKSFVDFEIPADGYAGTPLVVSGAADFGEVPAGQDAASWVPVNGIRVSAPEFKGKQVLLEAGSISGLSADRVYVDAPPAVRVKVSLDETSLSVQLLEPPTLIVVR